MAGKDLAKAMGAVLKDDQNQQRGSASLRHLDLDLPGNNTLALDVVVIEDRLRGFRLTHHYNNLPRTFLQFGNSCQLLGRRDIIYDQEDKAQHLVVHPQGNILPLNPPLPSGKPADGQRILMAHIDSGVDYTIPGLAAALAFSPEGRLIGYDFWDDDPFPFDADTSVSPFFPRQHGSYVLDILIGTGAPVAVMPFRYPRTDMSRFGDIVHLAAEKGARLVMIPMGSNEQDDWHSLEQAARAHPEMIFLFSAGNNGLSLDETPIYPAAFSAPHFITVTSTLADATLGEGSNHGHMVDFSVMGENLSLTYAEARTGTISGTSFALPRLAGFLACLMAKEPSLGPKDILARARALARPSARPAQYMYFLPDAQIAASCDQ